MIINFPKSASKIRCLKEEYLKLADNQIDDFNLRTLFFSTNTLFKTLLFLSNNLLILQTRQKIRSIPQYVNVIPRVSIHQCVSYGENKCRYVAAS